MGDQQTTPIVIMKSIAGPDFSWRPGQIVEVSAEEAEKWCDGERARYLHPLAPIGPTGSSVKDEQASDSPPAISDAVLGQALSTSLEGVRVLLDGRTIGQITPPDQGADEQLRSADTAGNDVDQQSAGALATPDDDRSGEGDQDTAAQAETLPAFEQVPDARSQDKGVDEQMSPPPADAAAEDQQGAGDLATPEDRSGEEDRATAAQTETPPAVEQPKAPARKATKAAGRKR